MVISNYNTFWKNKAESLKCFDFKIFISVNKNNVINDLKIF